MNKSTKKNKQLGGKDLFIIAICLFVLSGLINSVLHGFLVDILSVAFTAGALISLIAAPIVAIKNKKPQSAAQTLRHKRDSADIYTDYATSIIGVSVAASRDLVEPLHLNDNQKHKLINEAFGFSVFMTTMQLQARKVPNAKIDVVIDTLSDSLALKMSEMAGTTHAEALNQIIQSGQHFYREHKPIKSSDGGDLLQKIATSYLKEYRPKDYEDFFALTKITLTFGNISKVLSETGFSKKI